MYKTLLNLTVSIFLLTACHSTKKTTVPPTYGQAANSNAYKNTNTVSDNKDTLSVIKDIGEIGDVKYSVLNYDDFKTENGYGWVLLDGSPLIDTTDLYRYKDNFPLNGAQHVLPNAMGFFIRGMDLNETDGIGNPEKQKMGAQKNDTIQFHSHPFNKGNFMNNSGNTNGVQGKSGNFSGKVGFSPEGINIQGSGGLETRPRNIALYIYIKVKHYKKDAKK